MAWEIKQHPEVVYTDLVDGAVLLHLETKLYYSLNEAGTAIWRLLNSTESREDLIQGLTSEYDVEKERAEASVSEFIQELERNQLVLPDQEGPEVQTTAEHRYEGSAGVETSPAKKKPFAKPELLKHDEPLHGVVMNPFDPQLPLAE
jgi:hypothetical protein